MSSEGGIRALKKEKNNYRTHTILQPEDCDCGKRGTDEYCNICDGGLAFCTRCKGGEIDLVEKSCDERIIDQLRNRLKQLKEALDHRLGHCKRHNTFFDDEPCWQCIREEREKEGKDW